MQILCTKLSCVLTKHCASQTCYRQQIKLDTVTEISDNAAYCICGKQNWWYVNHLLTPWSGVLLEKLTSFQLAKKFPTFYGTWRFITSFTSACHLTLPWASSIQSIPPHPTSWRSILILSSHLLLGLPSGLLPSGFPIKILYTPLISPIHATCSAHLIILNFITQTILGEEYRSLSFSLCSFLYSPVTSSPLGPNILLSILFSNTLSLRSSLNVSDHVSHPYKTTGKIKILYTFMFKCESHNH